ncbi:MAG: glycosyltransferase family 4 protein [Sphingomonas sp.]|uniref:glycosyltransferase family 4 protein n=1 Tax=Sphingomonas sp. TaxID=28214 RepID=UPI001B0222D7|nr:glycosyltransferase family 4 protein [Sphingomonas sp.]MBO9623889.1 glycosyltransferase family 4 protein [Sphingomonas sp.]
MHIGLCSPHWPPSAAANGIVSYVSAIRDFLMSQGHSVSVIAEGQLFDPDGRSLPLAERQGHLDAWVGRLVRRTDRWRGNLPGLGRSVAAQVRTAHRISPIDILEMEESFGWCGIVQRRTRVPVVTRLHGPYFLKPELCRPPNEERRDGQRCEAEGAALRGARSLSAPTRAILDATCRHYRLAPCGPTAVIPNPIPIPCEVHRWNIDGCDPNRILMVGRFDYPKGADTMLAAFVRLLAARPDACLTLVGPDIGVRNASNRLLNFEEYALANLPPSARARVTFTGPLAPEHIMQLRREAYVTVLASRLENFPYALLEGLAQGCPMISTAWPGSDEILVDGFSGLLTPVGDPDALAARLQWLMNDPGRASRIAANGLRSCRERFSIEAVGPAMLRHYEASLRASKQ